jgi:hypothetical protein
VLLAPADCQQGAAFEFGDKGYADRRAEDRWSVVRCESQRADPRPRSGAFDGDLEFDAVTAAPGREAVVSKCPDDIAPVPKSSDVLGDAGPCCYVAAACLQRAPPKAIIRQSGCAALRGYRRVT